MLKGIGSYAVTASKDGKVGTKVLADFAGNRSNNAITNNSASRVGGGSRGIYDRKILEGFVNYLDIDTIREICRDMYRFDPITGTIIEIKSTMPFSPFELTGLPNQEMLNVYAENIDAMDIMSTSSEIAKTHMVDGEYVGQINEDTNLNLTTGIIPIDVAALSFVTLPFPNRDPIIDVNIPDDLKALLRSKDKRVIHQFEKYGSSLKDMIKGGKYPLDPRTTIYYPHRSLATQNRGTSYLERIIPVWLIEKALMKGTIDLAHRRQKSILHLMCLSGDNLINVDGSLKRIDSICSRKGMKPGEYKEVKFKTKGRDGEIVNVNKWFYNGQAFVKKIQTEPGHYIKATDNHKVLVLEQGPELVWKEVKNLKIGDYLCHDANISKSKNEKILRLNVTKKTFYKTTKNYKLPAIMNTKLAYLMGLILSDGTIREFSIYIVNTNMNILNTAKKYYKDLFDIDTNIRKLKRHPLSTMPLYVLEANSVIIIDFFNKIGMKKNSELNLLKLIRKVSSKKEMPWSILQADDESKYAFISAYIDGDGGIYISETKCSVEIRISSSSKKMLEKFQIMLLDLGVKNTRYGSCNLVMNRNDGTNIYKKLKKYLKHEKKIFKLLPSLNIDKCTDLPTKFFNHLIEERFSGKGKYRQYVYKNDKGKETLIPGWEVVADQVLIGRVRQLLSYTDHQKGQYDDLIEKMQIISKTIASKVYDLLDIGYTFEPITSITKLKKKQHVYDLSVKNGQPHAFLANGIVVHNCGSEDYLPSENQLAQYARLFADADADPLGAVVATRPDIQTNELRSGSDFWSVETANDYFTQQKMRNFGVSDSVISGDMTVDATANAMMIFLDGMRSFRENFTRKIYYQKVLLNIAIRHGFTRNSTPEVVTGKDIDEKHIMNMYGPEMGKLYIETMRDSRLISGDNMVVTADDNISYRLSDYHLPKIHYHKALKPEGNSELMTNLQAIQTQGLPIPLRIWAVAAGISIPELVRMMPEDIKLRKSLQNYKSKWPVDPNAQAAQLLQSSLSEVVANSRRAKELKPLNRDFSNIETRDTDTGRILSKKGVAVKDEKANKIIVEAATRVNSEYNRRIKSDKPINAKYHTVKTPVKI